MLMGLTLAALVLAAIPAWLFRANLPAYEPPPAPAGGVSLPRVSRPPRLILATEPALSLPKG